MYEMYYVYICYFVFDKIFKKNIVCIIVLK